MRLLTAAEQRELDRLAAAEAELPTRVLMESAGAAVARVVVALKPRKVVVFCGPGNNGGDGSVAARLLRGEVYEVYTWYTKAPEQLKGDAALAAKAWRASGGQVVRRIDESGVGVAKRRAVPRIGHLRPQLELQVRQPAQHVALVVGRHEERDLQRHPVELLRKA